MFALGFAVVVFLVFLAGVIREPRSFGNAVLLGLTLAFGALGAAEHLARTPGRPAHLLLALLLAVALGPLVIGGFLVANGVTMVRRESSRPGNLLSLLAGAAVFVVIGLDVAADRAGDLKLSLFAAVANLIFGYVSFLLVSYVLYAVLYGLLARTGGADFVVVLGSGLRPDGAVPPLLASRLERGREVWTVLNRQRELNREEESGRRADDFKPLLIVSGGKGDDERVPEASAMASYLIARGFPADRLLVEDRSRNTEENLLFSKAIMDELRPGARTTIVTSDFHAFRAALLARRLGIPGQVTGARVAGYYRPSAMLREFAAVFFQYRVVNLAICALLIIVPLGAEAVRMLLSRSTQTPDARHDAGRGHHLAGRLSTREAGRRPGPWCRVCAAPPPAREVNVRGEGLLQPGRAIWRGESNFRCWGGEPHPGVLGNDGACQAADFRRPGRGRTWIRHRVIVTAETSRFWKAGTS